MIIGSYLTPYTNVSVKWILDIKLKLWKFWKKAYEIFVTLLKISFFFFFVVNFFIHWNETSMGLHLFGMISKTWSIQEKKSWTPSELGTALQSSVKRVQKQATDWKKTFAIHLSDEFVSTMYKVLSILNSNKLHIPLKIGYILEDISPTKVHTWLITTWKDVQNHN